MNGETTMLLSMLAGAIFTLVIFEWGRFVGERDGRQNLAMQIVEERIKQYKPIPT